MGQPWSGCWCPKLISNFYWCRYYTSRTNPASPKLISNFYWCRYMTGFKPSKVQNSFRISTDVDRAVDVHAERVQNSFRISTDVDWVECKYRSQVQNSFRISTDVDLLMPWIRISPKLISNFYWCRSNGDDTGYSVQNSFRISTDVDRYLPVRHYESKTHFEFLLM